MLRPVDWVVIRPDWPAPPSVVALSTVRTGGVSAAPYGSFNLGDHVEDDPLAVIANRERLARHLGVERVQWLQQVHGVEAVQAIGATTTPEADAVWTREPELACAVLTADCLPVLFCSQQADVVGAAHAGWRGLVGGVLESTVAAMGVRSDHLLAWLGPAIGPTAFEVGSEVRSAFLDAAPSRHREATSACFAPVKAGTFMADLPALARLRLSTLGITRVYGGEHCTVSEPERFFSYRRDGRTGRMASVIALRGLENAAS